MMNVVNCSRRPSSKARQSSKLFALTRNLVSIEEENVVGGKSHSEKRGYLLMDDGTIVKCFRFANKVKINA